ncbi:hypothetical protein GEV33_002694 [Tenebrio molitor]|uniref:Cyclin N-terminal domain-containing protein n=1 Tax=Tenebrio molitor TaxID=7067 RepID=A0A8J6HR26_TENMO|nr:hypothetical protein GEV33_002694 [Tenebrio molitor]
MANFHVHEDVSSLIENVKPKNQKLTKVFPHAKNRAVLQPLCSYQQNAKPRKPDPEKENRAIVPTKAEDQNGSDSDPCNDLIRLKPVFKRTNLSSRVSNVNKEYEEQIWNYLNSLEKKMFAIKPHYMTKQVHLTWEMRAVLIDWLVSVAEEYKMNDNTLHLSVNYLDRFLSNISVVISRYQLL